MNAPARLTSSTEALEVAHKVAASIRATASDRDMNRASCVKELDLFSASGLWGITVPSAYGGPDLGYETLSQVVQIIAAADPSIAQIPRSHFHIVDLLAIAATDYQKDFFLSEIQKNKRLSQAASERGGKNALDISTKITKQDGKILLNGKKFYATGCLFADWIGVVAKDEVEDHVQAFIHKDAKGLVIEDDWTGFGQRSTASGTVVLDNVEVDPRHVMPFADVFIEPTMVGAASQLFHASIDIGISREAVDDAIAYVTTKSRPWVDSGLQRAAEDPYILQSVGDMKVRLTAAASAMEVAARKMDIHKHQLDDDLVAEISISVAIAKVLSTESAMFSTNKLFEVSGAGATLEKLNLNRHWRNARTHTLHDPVTWKYNAIGNYFVNKAYPKKHNYI